MDDNAKGAPFSYITVGGTDTDWLATYGKVSYLTPDQVAEVDVALRNLSDPELRNQYDPTRFRAEDIYPGGEVWNDREIEALLETLHEVSAFFSVAAREKDMVLVSSD